MTEDAEIVNVRFVKSVIASKAAFEYGEAQIRKDDPYARWAFQAVFSIADHSTAAHLTTSSHRASGY